MLVMLWFSNQRGGGGPFSVPPVLPPSRTTFCISVDQDCKVSTGPVGSPSGANSLYTCILHTLCTLYPLSLPPLFFISPNLLLRGTSGTSKKTLGKPRGFLVPVPGPGTSGTGRAIRQAPGRTLATRGRRRLVAPVSSATLRRQPHPLVRPGCQAFAPSIAAAHSPGDRSHV